MAEVYPPVEVELVFVLGVVAALIAFNAALLLAYWVPHRYNIRIPPEFVLLYVISGIGIGLLSNPAWIRGLVVSMTGNGSTTYVISLILICAGFVMFCMLYALGIYWAWRDYVLNARKMSV